MFRAKDRSVLSFNVDFSKRHFFGFADFKPEEKREEAFSQQSHSFLRSLARFPPFKK